MKVVMMMNLPKVLCTIAVAALPMSCWAGAGPLTVKAANKLAMARASETIELSAKDLAGLGGAALDTIHVKDATGKEVLCQAVDTDFDEYHKPDMVIFQADFGPNETKTFTISAGAKHVYTLKDFKAHGRFVRERFDDFAWENDLIAHRTYGKGLETWKGEPLTSSTIDIWSKRVPKMVIDEWYMVDNYHVDTGEGADDYSAGASRGCGGNGIWAGDKLWVSKNFIESRVLANGPIRVMFELVYPPFDANGVKVTEVKRITLDAGSQLDHFQSFYNFEGGGGTAPICGIGLKKVRGEEKEFNAANGWLTSWQAMEKNMGMQGIAIISDPKGIEKQAEDSQNNLLLVKTESGKPVSYRAGFAWDKAGRITTVAAWKKYVDNYAQALASPIAVEVSK